MDQIDSSNHPSKQTEQMALNIAETNSPSDPGWVNISNKIFPTLSEVFSV